MNKKKLFSLTRRSSFLWKHSLILGTLIVLFGTGISFLNTERMDDYHRVLASSSFETESLGEFEGTSLAEVVVDISEGMLEVLGGEQPFDEKLRKARQLFSLDVSFDDLNLPAAGQIANLSDQEYDVASAFIHAGLHPKNNEALQPLIVLAEAEIPNANYALALYYQSEHSTQKAEEALHHEIKLHDSDPARKMLVHTYLAGNDFDALFRIMSDSAFTPYITNYVLLKMALHEMDWPLILQAHIHSMYEGVRIPMVLLALLSGLVWLSILLCFNGSLSWKSLPVRLALPALLLGVLSTHATLFVIYWQEHQLGLTMGSDMVTQLIYCVLGIGLREETMKLLFFVPLIPFLLKRSDLEILTLAGLVGLGFAIEENINYFESTAGLSALGRFATANFLHIALTAMAGLTLTRAIIHRGEDIQHALVTFGTVVIVHGLYDAFIMVPALSDYSFFSITIFVWMGYQYFGWLRYLRDDWRDPVSITSIFTFGVVVVTGLSYCLYAWQVGPSLAIPTVGFEVLGVAVILILFYREIPETIN